MGYTGIFDAPWRFSVTYDTCDTYMIYQTRYNKHLHDISDTYSIHQTLTLYIRHLHYTSDTYFIHQTLTFYIRHLHYTSDTYRKRRTLALLVGYCHRCNRGRENNIKVFLCQEWWVATLQLANMFIRDRGQRSQQLERETNNKWG